MNFKSCIDLLDDITYRHEHLAETAMFRRLLLPGESDEKGSEGVKKDPLTGIPALKESLKACGKCL